LTLRPAISDRRVLAFDIAGVLEALAEMRAEFALASGEGAIEKSDSPYPLALLRARRKGPRHRRAANKRDEFASFHRITSRQARRS
jgi:hypothetical protein